MPLPAEEPDRAGGPVSQVQTGAHPPEEADPSILARPNDDGGGPADANVSGDMPIQRTGELQQGPGEKPKPARTAVVYLPPLVSSAGSSLLAVTQRLADAASLRSPTLLAYTARDANESIRFGQSDEYGAPRCIITSRSAPSLSILDVFELDYRRSIFGETDVQSPIRKFLIAAFTTLPPIASVARAAVARKIGRKHAKHVGTSKRGAFQGSRSRAAALRRWSC